LITLTLLALFVLFHGFRYAPTDLWVDMLPVFSDPAHPEQNGRHQRAHRDLKAVRTKMIVLWAKPTTTLLKSLYKGIEQQKD
jgi:hypothetical protein